MHYKLEITMDPKDYKRKLYKMISPLEILRLKEDLNQNWEGEVWIRTNFTGWNMIEVSVNKN